MAKTGALTSKTPDLLENSFRKLQNILSGRLNFEDNIQSFVVEDVVFTGFTEVQIRNRFPHGKLPTKYLVTRQTNGSAAILRDGPTEWTSEFIYLVNAAGAASTVSILFIE